MNNTFDNKTVVVIGGSSGMGLAVAKESARSGARVVIASRRSRRCRTCSNGWVPSTTW